MKKTKNKTEERIRGIDLDLHYNGSENITLELVKITNIAGGYYEIHFESDEHKLPILKLHIEEAIELKSMIDSLVYNSLMDRIETKENENGTN